MVMKCPICGSHRIYPYREIKEILIFQCRKCLLAFVDSNVSRKSTTEIYSFSEYVKREKQFRKRYKNTLGLVKRFAKGKKVLDVGAGFGLLSSVMAHAGYTVVALEPHVVPVYLKETSCIIIKKKFESFAKKTKDKFDVIILFDVLEHVDNPKESVLLLNKLLKTNGIAIIQIPNYLSYMAQILREWSWWMIEDHRFFFSKISLNLLFAKKIWKERYSYTYEDWIDFKKNLDGNFGSNKMAKLLFFSWWAPFYFLCKRIIWAMGRGGLIVSVYQKK